MSMKKILMTAVAVSALSAGAASAAILSPSSTVANIPLTRTTFTGTTSATALDALSIATEKNAPLAATSVLKFTPSTATAIPAGTNVVTWNVAGGTFGTVGSVISVDSGTSPACTVSSASTTSVVAVCTHTGTLTSYNLTVPIALGTTKTPVSVSGSITTQGGTAVDGGAITGGTIVDYRAGLVLSAVPVAKQLKLSTFRSFVTIAGNPAAITGATNNATIATGVGFVANDSLVYSTDLVYADAGAAATSVAGGTIASMITASDVTVAGTLSTFKPVIAEAAAYTVETANADAIFGTSAQSPAVAGTGTVTLTAATLSDLVAGTAVVGLAQSGLVAIAGTQSAYALTAAPTMATGFTAGTYAAATLGSVTYQGTSFLAPWVGDGSNGITYTIRLGNKSALSAVPFVQATLVNPYTTGTTGTAVSGVCALGSIPAGGELLISSSTLATCFGAFKRSDVTITAGSVDAAALATAVTAKMRASAGGVVSDVALGGGGEVATKN